MNKKILFFTFFVLVILMTTPYTSSISICKEQQNFGVKSKLRINENLNDNNLIIKPFAIFFLFGKIWGWHINEFHDGIINRINVVFMGINLMVICFAHTDEYPLYFHKEGPISDRRVFEFTNDTLEFKGIFGQNFVCGFIIARPII